MPGLSSEEAGRRLAEHGPNALPEPRRRSWASRLLAEFRSPLVLLLLAALAIDLGLWWHEGAASWPLEGLAIAAVLVLNAVLGLVQQGRAEHALRALRELAQPRVRVLRDGEPRDLPATELVPGDRVRIEAGDRVPADGLVVERWVRVDESLLTGESVPVDRGAGEAVSAGTLVVRGGDWMDVDATGPASALGRIAAKLETLEVGATPLELRLHELGLRIARWALGAVALLVGVGGLVLGLPALPGIFLLAVALAVAAVPEGLPAILTLTLALGVERMARRNAVVRRLPAVEALGSVTLIATDKTGTITANQLEVDKLLAAEAEPAWAAMILASDADAGAGDPLDQALLRYAGEQGVDAEALRARWPVVSLSPFDARQACVSARVRSGDAERTCIKGAPEALLARCADEGGPWREHMEREAALGGRLIGLAWQDGDGPLRWAGLVVLRDPLREGIAESVARARCAGIRVALVTGDHPETARAIAAQAGIDEVHARVQPEQKLALIAGWQAEGEVVAMTGDGVNDALALRKADVGVAMGLRGSAVAREAADLVLLDDEFDTIVHAVEEGRSLYANIQSFLAFLFATNLAEVLVVLLGSAALMAWGGSGPVVALTAVQILWINLLTDSLPALALGLDRHDGMLGSPPRAPGAPLLGRRELRFVFGGAAALAAVSLGAGATSLVVGLTVEEARTAVFLVLVATQLIFPWSVRSMHGRPSRNLALVAAAVVGLGLQVVALSVPGLRAALALAAPSLTLLAIAAGFVAAGAGLGFVAARQARRGEG